MISSISSTHQNHLFGVGLNEIILIENVKFFISIFLYTPFDVTMIENCDL